jgi:hypothetical protein
MLDTESEVIKDIVKRQLIGIKKYGKTVAENPLSRRQWLQHAYEEALDLAIYLKRLIQEEDAEFECFPKSCPTCGFAICNCYFNEQSKIDTPTSAPFPRCVHGVPHQNICVECIDGDNPLIKKACETTTSAPVQPSEPSATRTVEDPPETETTREPLNTSHPWMQRAIKNPFDNNQ